MFEWSGNVLLNTTGQYTITNVNEVGIWQYNDEVTHECIQFGSPPSNTFTVTDCPMGTQTYITLYIGLDSQSMAITIDCLSPLLTTPPMSPPVSPLLPPPVSSPSSEPVFWEPVVNTENVANPYVHIVIDGNAMTTGMVGVFHGNNDTVLGISSGGLVWPAAAGGAFAGLFVHFLNTGGEVGESYNLVYTPSEPGTLVNETYFLQPPYDFIANDFGIYQFTNVP